METYLLPRAIIHLPSPWSPVASWVASRKSVGLNWYSPARDEHVWWCLTSSLWVPLSHCWSSSLAPLLSLSSVWNIGLHVLDTPHQASHPMPSCKKEMEVQEGNGGARSHEFSEIRRSAQQWPQPLLLLLILGDGTSLLAHVNVLRHDKGLVGDSGVVRVHKAHARAGGQLAGGEQDPLSLDLRPCRQPVAQSGLLGHGHPSTKSRERLVGHAGHVLRTWKDFLSWGGWSLWE